MQDSHDPPSAAAAPDPGAGAAPRRRGRPPDMGNRRSILEAARAELGEVGYTALTIDGVARRAELYRRLVHRVWRSKAHLVCDALFQSVTLPASIDTGSLDRDLQVVSATIAEILDRPEFARGLPGLVVELRSDDDLAAETLASHWAPAVAIVESVIDRAVARGELTQPSDASLALAAACGAQLALSQVGEPAGPSPAEPLVAVLRAMITR